MHALNLLLTISHSLHLLYMPVAWGQKVCDSIPPSRSLDVYKLKLVRLFCFVKSRLFYRARSITVSRQLCGSELLWIRTRDLSFSASWRSSEHYTNINLLFILYINLLLFLVNIMQTEFDYLIQKVNFPLIYPHI